MFFNTTMFVTLLSVISNLPYLCFHPCYMYIKEIYKVVFLCFFMYTYTRIDPMVEQGM